MSETYRLTPPVVLWWAWLAFVAANVADWAIQGTSARLALNTGAIMLAVTGVIYALALRPRVVADDRGLRVQNPFRDHQVPWPVIQSVAMSDWVLVRYGEADVPGGPDGRVKTIYCWALYVSARVRRQADQPPRMYRARSRLRGVGIEPGTWDSPKAPRDARRLASLPPAKAIAVRLNNRAEKARGSGVVTGPVAPVTTSWAWFPIAAVTVPLAAMLIVLLAV